MATTSVTGVVLGPIPSGVPHLQIPFALAADGSAMVVEQDTEAEVIQSVAMLVGTRPGTRLVAPSYGIPDPTFAGISPVVLQTAVTKWETRARVSLVTTPGNTEQVMVEVTS